jgi:organic hydroperoxide reductase OsmC/OhrA
VLPRLQQARSRPIYSGMSEHKAALKWARGNAEFSYQKYPRDHTWSFDGGHTMTGTAAPAYLGNPANVDPEEAFVASVASCHMLTFLAIACKQKFVLDSYEDAAVGFMERTTKGGLPSHGSSCGRNSPGAAIENRARKSSSRCTTPRTRTASSPTRSRPT